jgi:hypothetical protein
MATTATKQVIEKVQEKEKPANATASAPEHGLPQGSARAASSPEKKAVGYGLPCSHCHAYYPADMPACPICKCTDRVSPTAAVMHSTVAGASDGTSKATPQAATGTEIDRERELLLKELKSQAFASHMQINPVTTFQCVLAHQHSGSTEPAAVCHNCYSQVRQQADLLEAALHMDPKEAAKIVYDAVWADTSDPNASYFNAANAILSELRKRAGISLFLGVHQPLAH